MATTIALFNHKGGVSKTTTTLHLGWMLASKGNTVLLVDADPQCNLTGLVLGYKGRDEFESFYTDSTHSNIKSGLEPAFESRPSAITSVECIPVPKRKNLFLLPGHIGLSEYEVTLGIAQELSGSIQTLQNLPGSIAYLLSITANAIQADYVLIDLNPSLSSINQNILMTSDYFLIPASPDYFSVLAIDSLAAVLPKWSAWGSRARSLPLLRNAAYPFPNKCPKFLGTVIQKYRPRAKKVTIDFQQWINQIGQAVQEKLIPSLKASDMLLPDGQYQDAELGEGHNLALIPDFNTLIAKSQKYATPVFALSKTQMERTGVVLEKSIENREVFKKLFTQLADRVIHLTR